MMNNVWFLYGYFKGNWPAIKTKPLPIDFRQGGTIDHIRAFTGNLIQVLTERGPGISATERLQFAGQAAKLLNNIHQEQKYIELLEPLDEMIADFKKLAIMVRDKQVIKQEMCRFAQLARNRKMPADLKMTLFYERMEAFEQLPQLIIMLNEVNDNLVGMLCSILTNALMLCYQIENNPQQTLDEYLDEAVPLFDQVADMLTRPVKVYAGDRVIGEIPEVDAWAFKLVGREQVISTRPGAASLSAQD